MKTRSNVGELAGRKRIFSGIEGCEWIHTPVGSYVLYARPADTFIGIAEPDASGTWTGFAVGTTKVVGLVDRDRAMQCVEQAFNQLTLEVIAELGVPVEMPTLKRIS